MTTSVPVMNLTNGNGKQCDDLTKIKGIGLVKQQWLRESLNIYTFRDLASLSVDAIESVLKVEWQTLSRQEIKTWIFQAQELAADEPSLKQFVELSNTQAELVEELPIESSQLSESSRELVNKEAELVEELPIESNQSSNPLVKSLDTADEGNLLPSVINGEWRSFASFKVEFQSRPTERQVEEQQVTIYYLESDQVQSWSSMESDRLQQWMLEQIQISATDRMQQLPEARSSVAVPLVVVEIDEIRAFQPAQTNRPMVARESNRLFPGTISSNYPFGLEISFSLAGLNVANITKPSITYFVQVYVRNRVTDVINHLGDTKPCSLAAGQLSYTAMLPGITLEPGVYRLQASVKLQGIPATPGSFKVPLLQVI